MKIYEPMVANGYEWVNAVHPDDYEMFLQFDGLPRAHVWKPVLVRRVRADKRSVARESDFPWLGGHVLILRRRALDCLADLIAECGEALPLATEDGTELFLLNIRKVDALDENESVLVRFPSSEKIMRIKKVAFVREAIVGLDLFRLPLRSGTTYVSERFVQRVRDCGLLGLEFTEAWSG